MMDSECSQDTFFCFKDGEKDLMAYEEEEMLALEEIPDSTIENQCDVIKPESNASTAKKQNFSLLMSAIDYFNPRGDEPEEELMHPACASTHQPEESDIFELPRAGFVIENESTLSLSDISQAGDLVGDIQEGTAMSPSKIPVVEMVSGAAQEEDLESKDDSNACQTSNEIHNEPQQPLTEPLSHVGLHLFHNEQIMHQADSILEINNTPERTNQEDFSFNWIGIAAQLLEAAAAQMEPRLIVRESTLTAIANGLQLSIACGYAEDNALIVDRGIGPMVADILLDSQTGIILGFAVARLVPRPIVDSSGCEQGSLIHQVIRGFAIDDNARHIITEGVGTTIWEVNHPMPSGE